MRTFFAAVSAVSLCGGAMGGVLITSPGQHGSNASPWSSPLESPTVTYSTAGFQYHVAVEFNAANPTPFGGAEIGFVDQVVRVNDPLADHVPFCVNMSAEALYAPGPADRGGGAAPGPISVTIGGPGGLFPLEAGSTNAPISPMFDAVVLDPIGPPTVSYSAMRQFELPMMATNLDTFFYFRPTIIVDGMGGDNPLDVFTVDLTITVAYEVLPAPGAATLFGLAGLAGLRRRR